MFGKHIKFVTTFLQISFTDFDIILTKNRGEANLFCVLVCVTVSDCNKDISQIRAGFDMILVANERYISLVSSTKKFRIFWTYHFRDKSQTYRLL